jgi:pyrroline-5-carboxylate reductase
MTVISANPAEPLPAECDEFGTWLFTRLSRVVHMPSSTMDACTAVCGVGPAFAALMLEAVADGACLGRASPTAIAFGVDGLCFPSAGMNLYEKMIALNELTA